MPLIIENNLGKLFFFGNWVLKNVSLEHLVKPFSFEYFNTKNPKFNYSNSTQNEFSPRGSNPRRSQDEMHVSLDNMEAYHVESMKASSAHRVKLSKVPIA